MDSATKIADPETAAFRLPRLTLADGTVEALKYLALLLMTVDHVNKYLLHDAAPVMFNAGRLAMPLFGFVMAFNLARPGALERGVYGRVLRRLAITGSIASIPFIALGGLGWSWWPLNILFMLFVATAIMLLIELDGKGRFALAVLLFIVGGGLVEFWWPGISLCLGAWRYCKQPSAVALIVWLGSTAALFAINKNLWALAALPLLFLAPSIRINLPRSRHFFYEYYPIHLAVLWGVRHWLSK